VAGHHDPALRILDEAGGLVGLALARDDAALDVADAGGQAHDRRTAEALGHREGLARHVVGLLRVGGLEQRQVGEAGPEARVLLVLRRRQADVVGHRDDQTADHAGQRQRHQRVGRDVEADVLHAAEGTRTGIGGADRHLQRYLLVDRPFGIDVRVGRNDLQHLGGRRAGIGRGDLDAGFPDGAGDGFVAGHQHAAGGRDGHDCCHEFSSKDQNRKL